MGYVICAPGGRAGQVGQAKLIESNETDRVSAYAMAAESYGFGLFYLEAGSGAKNKIPGNVIRKITSEIDIGLIVGGGIRTPQMAKNIVESGASYVVIGSAIEESLEITKEFSSAIHCI